MHPINGIIVSNQWNNFIRENNRQSSNFKTIDLKAFSKGKLKRILKQYCMDSYKESMPVQWLRTKWFVSQTIEINGHINISLNKCNTFKCTKLPNGLKLKITWGHPTIITN